MDTAELEKKEQFLSEVFARNARPTAARYGATENGQDYILSAQGHSFYAHAQRDGSYSIRRDDPSRRTILDIADAALMHNQPEQQKIKILADCCAGLVMRP
jgi:hypothetical protein